MEFWLAAIVRAGSWKLEWYAELYYNRFGDNDLNVYIHSQDPNERDISLVFTLTIEMFSSKISWENMQFNENMNKNIF